MSNWWCVVCGTYHPPAPGEREAMLCRHCGSTWRVRATALAVLAGTGRPIAPLPEVEPDWSWRGLGTSDHVALAGALTARFDYTNTYYHRYPRLDLLDVPPDLEGQVGFVVCSDVLEHVPPPADRALVGLRRLLRPGGFVVLTVPCIPDAPTREFYPDLVDWEVTGEQVRWTDAAGTTRVDEAPEFHGGPGQTLAFRLWGAPDLRARLEAAGFRSVVDCPLEPTLGVPEISFPGAFLAVA